MTCFLISTFLRHFEWHQSHWCSLIPEEEHVISLTYIFISMTTGPYKPAKVFNYAAHGIISTVAGSRTCSFGPSWLWSWCSQWWRWPRCFRLRSCERRSTSSSSCSTQCVGAWKGTYSINNLGIHFNKGWYDSIGAPRPFRVFRNTNYYWGMTEHFSPLAWVRISALTQKCRNN